GLGNLSNSPFSRAIKYPISMRVLSRISCMLRPSDSLASFSRRPISRDTRHTSHGLSHPNKSLVSFLFEYNLLRSPMSKSPLDRELISPNGCEPLFVSYIRPLFFR